MMSCVHVAWTLRVCDYMCTYLWNRMKDEFSHVIVLDFISACLIPCVLTPLISSLVIPCICTEERKKAMKKIIDTIPSKTQDLFATFVQWEIVDQDFIQVSKMNGSV